jgi:glycosyltransferase involved in cell wall biosynthesis
LVEDGITGHIASLDDADAWATALIKLLRDRRRAAAMGQSGAARVAQISDPYHVADLAIAAYKHAQIRWQNGQRARLRRGRAGSKVPAASEFRTGATRLDRWRSSP